MYSGVSLTPPPWFPVNLKVSGLASWLDYPISHIYTHDIDVCTAIPS